MSSSIDQSLQRRCFGDASAPPTPAAQANSILQLLLTQDGSTTRLCEAVAGGPVTLHVIEQQVLGTAPAEVRSVLPGAGFIERITCLAARGQVLMDNLSYIALDGLAPDVRRDLEDGVIPIGHLLSRMWVRRSFLDPSPALYAKLWDAVGLPDPDASRVYCIATPDGPRMMIAETFRQGMLMSRGLDVSTPSCPP
jgi:chorismate-pyruvate lyase